MSTAKTALGLIVVFGVLLASLMIYSAVTHNIERKPINCEASLGFVGNVSEDGAAHVLNGSVRMAPPADECEDNVTFQNVSVRAMREGQTLSQQSIGDVN